MKPHFTFSEENQKEIQEILARYPENRTSSATLPLLHLAQKQSGGWLPQDAIEAVARFLNIPFMRVFEVATFYTMFKLKPVGEHCLGVCTTTPCWLRGSNKLLEACKKHLNINPGETSKDNMFSLFEVECLGACANAPVVQIDDDYYEDLDGPALARILKTLKSGEKPLPGSAKKRTASKPSCLEEKQEKKDA